MERARKSKQKQPIRVINTEESEYDGSSDKCPLCCSEFLADESVLRLTCRHVYHVDCWTEYLRHSPTLSCPVCRGGCHIVARYRVPKDGETAQAESHEPSRPTTPDQAQQAPDTFHIFTPPGRHTRTESQSPEVGTPFMSPENGQFGFPWWPGLGADTTAAYHSISIPNRAGIIIDPGAYTNLIGERTARTFARMAVEQGYKPRQWRMKPMFVQGVGEGQQKCEWTVSIPIACRLSLGGNMCCLNFFEAPVVGGSGANLPALLGLRSLTALSATLRMQASEEALYLPLPGANAEDLSQCRKCPLSKAPSGHLILTIDHWSELKTKSDGGVQPESMVLHTESQPHREFAEIPAAM